MSRKYTKIEMLSDEILHCIERCNAKLRQPMFTRRNRYWENIAAQTTVLVERTPQIYSSVSSPRCTSSPTRVSVMRQSMS